MTTSYDQTKRCPRCQKLAPALKHTKLEACLFCNYPSVDPRYDPFFRARDAALQAANKRRI